TAESAGRLRREITAHGSIAGVRNLDWCTDDERSTGLASCGDGLERTCHGGECRAAAVYSTGIDSHRGIAETIFRLQPVSGDRPVGKGAQNRPRRLARDEQIFRTARGFARGKTRRLRFGTG